MFDEDLPTKHVIGTYTQLIIHLHGCEDGFNVHSLLIILNKLNLENSTTFKIYIKQTHF